MAGLQKLYMGINRYDALVHLAAMNCYQYKSARLLGLDQFSIDLHYPGVDLVGEGDISVLISTSASGKGSKWSTVQISPQTIRTDIDFYPDTVYRVCFILKAAELVGKQYGVVVNMPSTPMLYPSQYLYNTSPQEYISQSYQMFEYINYNSDTTAPMAITLTNCLGRVDLLASPSYADMLTGKLTQIQPRNLWTNNGITVGLVQVDYGYYYIGIVSKGQAPNIYKLDINAAPSGLIAEKQFTINWGIGCKAYPIYGDSQQE